MAVSKTVVIALVAIIAVPILLGYAMNLTETTETDYKVTGQAVNVTPLLQNGTDFNYSHGDTYQLNTRFSNYTIPLYEDFVYNKTALQLGNENFAGSGPLLNVKISHWSYMYMFYDYDYNTSGYPVLNILMDNTTPITTCDHFRSMYYDVANQRLVYTKYTSNTTIQTFTYDIPDIDRVYTKMTYVGTYTGTGYLEYLFSDGSVNPGKAGYVNLSAGYHFEGIPNTDWTMKLPDYTKNALITIDLDSITASSYSIRLGTNSAGFYTLDKTTVGSEVTWTLTQVTNPARTWQLYYDPSVSHNTYQIYWDLQFDHIDPNDSNYHYYTSHREFRYVGEWPEVIGEANTYWSITDDVNVRSIPNLNFNSFSFYSLNNTESRSPVVRVDDSEFRAFEYPVISDKTYTPSNFKSNPSTTINDIVSYGSSITFGGNTYDVSSEGTITLNGHKIPVKNMVLSSVPNENGTYDNKIGNTIISTSGLPSTITFNGRWSASITTQSLEQYSYTKTEWVAGHFAWDGIDHNFLIVGLITCLGVFIGCGIYARRSRSGGVIPLMIVTGCAAFVFFIML